MVHVWRTEFNSVGLVTSFTWVPEIELRLLRLHSWMARVHLLSHLAGLSYLSFKGRESRFLYFVIFSASHILLFVINE